MTQELTPGALNDSVQTAILESARELFARFGYKKTTMEDIAQVLGKGKSSLYYYFKNKEEIFQAVIKWEGDLLFSKLQKVLQTNDAPDVKMRNYVVIRMENIRELQNYHVTLKQDVPGGFEFLEQIKNDYEQQEVQMIESIMQEGLDAGLFHLNNTNMAAVAIVTALKGLETPLLQAINQKNYEDFRVQINNILNILFYGLIKRD
ncbi:TetR family transcriptional regulator [Breznakibacter xylanolyticus]|uniref:TetR family transcriptional regulator n=1 Tax=Breznakibacter xylanolyticus TaxID=990 RepID=A0A2W7NDV7_9BACT|nr:TetR/AcrR family transcriptional regulator [Breznakibacter xylanolyticus]MBN2744746.1 TetR/AcrR family transcriptional regulator [Marinilabiliaceae bacterium]PZX18595.1 TetR family transcriptional regulator [Breznakibacter xylanolyticus]